MLSWVKPIRHFFRGPGLSGNAGRTFRFHLAYAVLDAATGGILLNAPLVAIKAFEAANWHLPLRGLYSGVGMIAALYLGCWMAQRRKMPFVFIPGVLAAVSVLVMAGALGHLIDRSNPWVSWAWIRLVWGLDALILAATPFYETLFPPALVILPVLGRILRGSVQGGWWIMWWQIGVTHFAPPGENTSRYMGIMVFLNGVIRFGASAAGMALAAMAVPPGALLIIGGLGVIFSGIYSFWQAAAERRERRAETMTEFEHQFTDGARPSTATRPSSDSPASTS